jgi:hypothetical protein
LQDEDASQCRYRVALNPTFSHQGILSFVLLTSYDQSLLVFEQRRGGRESWARRCSEGGSHLVFWIALATLMHSQMIWPEFYHHLAAARARSPRSSRDVGPEREMHQPPLKKNHSHDDEGDVTHDENQSGFVDPWEHGIRSPSLPRTPAPAVPT